MTFSLRWLSWKWLKLKILRQEGTPESLARGVGLGIFVGFACPLGTHLLIGLPLAFILRANKLLAILLTMPFNPYTLPITYPLQCWLGVKILGLPVSFKQLESEFAQLFLKPSWENLMALEHDALLPLILGGIIFGLIFGFAGYFASLGMVQRYRKRKEAKLRKRLSLLSKR